MRRGSSPSGPIASGTTRRSGASRSTLSRTARSCSPGWRRGWGAGLRARGGCVALPAARALAALVLVVGLGSFLFHTLAVRWAMLADVIPIAVFINAYFFLAMRRFLGLWGAGALAATIAFAGFAAGLSPLI